VDPDTYQLPFSPVIRDEKILIRISDLQHWWQVEALLWDMEPNPTTTKSLVFLGVPVLILVPHKYRVNNCVAHGISIKIFVVYAQFYRKNSYTYPDISPARLFKLLD
jgi:hypothetical protein